MGLTDQSLSHSVFADSILRITKNNLVYYQDGHLIEVPFNSLLSRSLSTSKTPTIVCYRTQGKIELEGAKVNIIKRNNSSLFSMKLYKSLVLIHL